MAERGALPLLRPSLPRPSIFLSFSNLRASRFQKPTSSASHLHYPSSSRSTVVSVKIIRRRFIYKIRAVAEEEGRYGRMERGKRGRKRRQLWEELLEDNVEDDDDDVDGGGGGDNGKIDLWKILEEIVDNVWILKAFKSYGYLLPFILLSLFFSTGPKAFLISLGVAIGPSLLFLAFQKVTGWDKRRRTSTANQFGVEMGDERRSRVRYTPSQVRNSGSAGMASNFGGWDELEGLGTVSEQPRTEPRRKPMKKRKKIRREEAAEAQPLLLRLLVSLFPFLSSYTNMLK
ncbi:BnaA04g19280D [Brassica napus]|uniref:BnaA04g19280D protein n=1 Tax=Brassica napus TaxID=3708 RepID=A0A078HHC0_BRANA|nr:BnaA04g19280D [Brassica napus]